MMKERQSHLPPKPEPGGKRFLKTDGLIKYVKKNIIVNILN